MNAYNYKFSNELYRFKINDKPRLKNSFENLVFCLRNCIISETDELMQNPALKRNFANEGYQMEDYKSEVQKPEFHENFFKLIKKLGAKEEVLKNYRDAINERFKSALKEVDEKNSKSFSEEFTKNDASNIRDFFKNLKSRSFADDKTIKTWVTEKLSGQIPDKRINTIYNSFFTKSKKIMLKNSTASKKETTLIIKNFNLANLTNDEKENFCKLFLRCCSNQSDLSEEKNRMEVYATLNLAEDSIKIIEEKLKEDKQFNNSTPRYELQFGKGRKYNNRETPEPKGEELFDPVKLTTEQAKGRKLIKL